jgi:hypothetical protein|tara:strand:+ start:234 stop:1106 length:873 start_codon:yes stop_codon:yes gene_type:complete
MELKKDIIESMNEDISNKIADIADLVGEKEEVVRDRLKTLNFRDYIELSKAVKEVEMERAREILGLGIEEAKYYYDGKVSLISKKEFDKIHKDFKNDTPGEERMVILDPESGATVSVPVKFMNEETEEVNEDEKQIAADIKDYVDDHKKHFDAYPMDVEVDDKVYSYDEYWKMLDKYYPVNEYNTGGTMSPGEMRASQQGQAMAQSQGDNNPQNKTKKAQAMMRLGKKNLGGATAQQAADALDKAGQGKPLTPIQRKAMAQQAASVDQLAADPKTATQFRNLLNKLNNKG